MIRPRLLSCLVIGAVALPVASCSAQPAAAPRAPASAPVANPPTAPAPTLEQIMADPDWIGASPERPYWADDSASIYFSRKKPGSEERELVQIDPAGNVLRVVADAERAHADVPGGELSRDRTRKVFSRAGDLYLKDLRTGAVRQLTRTAEEETAPRFMLGDNRIAFRRGSAVLIRELDTGFELQPADLRAEDDPDGKKDEEGDLLQRQQTRLFDFIKDRRRRRDEDRERERRLRDADGLRAPRPWYLGGDVEIRESSLSPGGRWMLVRLARKGAHEGRRDAMPQYVAESGYVESRTVRAKVGTGRPAGESLVLLDLEKRERHDLDLSVLPGIADDPLRSVRESGAARTRERDEARAWVIQPPPDSPQGKTEADDLRLARRLIEGGDPRSAAIVLTRWIDGHAGHADLPLALRLRGDALVLAGEPDLALQDYERVARDHAASAQLDVALERELELAARWIKADGTRRSRDGEYDPRAAGAEALRGVQDRLPGSALARRAAAAMIDHLIDTRRLPLAAESFQAFVRMHPDAPEAPGLKDRLARAEAAAAAPEPKSPPESPKPRPVGVRDIEWSDDGSRAAVQLFSLDNKDRWIAAVDLDRGALVPLERDTDEAWINSRFTDMGWVRDAGAIWFLSERTGWSHLYVRDASPEAQARPLTRGAFEVDDVRPSPDGRWLYCVANAGHPGEHEVWRVAPEGGAPEQLTALHGRTSAILSPDGSRLLLTHSTPTRPPELYVQDAAPGAEAHRVTNSVTDAFAAIAWIEPAIVEVPSRRGGVIHARLYAPADPSTREQRPAVLFIHGAGYLQNAHRGWSTYFREFMFHTLLARRGYVVLDMDYRASAGYGREWRTAIYRRMGTPELEDLEDGVRWLVEHHGVDPARVGCYGGSYGGFLTLMAMFTRPDLFACGAALRPVTDWAHYNDPYTASILNTPDADPEAYERSSPIEFAAGLRRPLLICHGMQDDNVFFQDTVRLAQRLIELGRQDWEVAMYPIEPHAFQTPASWLDEYRRILRLFETHLK